ncbi:hypothetical protein C8Q80DRAFT_1351776 [Daedaleopsis nitida]|nr:hypothetical protein C8Q80DRAFT_1351776 [Daedaleopsis nitida]
MSCARNIPASLLPLPPSPVPSLLCLRPALLLVHRLDAARPFDPDVVSSAPDGLIPRLDKLERGSTPRPPSSVLASASELSSLVSSCTVLAPELSRLASARTWPPPPRAADSTTLVHLPRPVLVVRLGYALSVTAPPIPPDPAGRADITLAHGTRGARDIFDASVGTG